MSRSRELIQWSGISVSGKSGLPRSSQSLIVKRNVSRWQKKSWDGKSVGNGEMDIDNDQLNKRIDYTLTFLKPFKAVSPVSFDFESKEGGVEITWIMEGSVPVFLFFMTKMMSAFL